jgi:outer membrane protein TolC
MTLSCGRREGKRAGLRAAAAGALLALVAASGASAPRAEELRLELDKAIELALASDETLLRVSQAVAGAEGQVLEARSNALPQLSLTGQYGRNILRPSFFLPGEFFENGSGSVRIEIGEDNDFMGAASVSQVLWAAGRVSAGLKGAKEYLASFRWRERAAADYVRFAVKQDYYGAGLASEALLIEEKAYEAAAEAARIARAGFEQGAVSAYDKMRAEVELANREAPLVRAKNARELAFFALKRRCGIDATAEISLVDTLAAPEHPASMEASLAAMRAGSAELRALEHAALAQGQFLRIAKAARYPILQLNAYYALQTQWSNEWLPPDELVAKSAAVQVGLQVPIFDGFRAKGGIQKAKADLRSAELELERAARDRELAVRQSHLSLENALIQLAGREESVKLAEETYRIALVRLSNGLATPLERLDAELALTAARVQLAEARYSSRMAQAYLELAVGSEAFKAIDGMHEKKETGHGTHR